MKVEVTGDIHKDPDAWHREWHDLRNAAVAALVTDGRSVKPRAAVLTRDEFHDDRVRWFFWHHFKPDSELSQSDKMASSDARLYEGVVGCMEAARDDERKRIASVLSNALKLLLGEEFTSLMYDVAQENEINIGYD